MLLTTRFRKCEMMKSIETVQKTIVYLEDHLLQPFTLDDLSNYLEESAFHITQSFTMITGMTVEEYLHSRKMTEAANYLLNGNYRLVDVAKKYGYTSAHEFSTAFSEFHGTSPIQARANPEKLQMVHRLYLQLSTTTKPPAYYSIKRADHTELVGKSVRIDNQHLSNQFLIPDLIYNENQDGFIDELLHLSTNGKLYVTLHPDITGVHIFIGVQSERSYHYETSAINHAQYAVFHSRGHLDYIFSEIWYSIEKQVDLQLNYLRNEQFIYVLPSDYAFDNNFNKVELWIPIERQFY
ncbi:AraC family transcriptional regulator [Macrococcoides caseolyticum]|nr:helix-turn-helix domain-containing protein [Macrococcus caseolyticus]ARQ04636.1 AraC family transcriptional regulator [Macrococcus caseolyticus]